MTTFQKISHSWKYNLITITISCILATVLIYMADFAPKLIEIQKSIMSIPLILTLVTTSLYGLSRLIGKKYNWILF